MTTSNRGFRHRTNAPYGRAADGQSENSGNRKTFDDARVPPDNIGNKLDDPIAEFLHDGTGNSSDEEPTHLKSGILACLAQASAKNIIRRRYEGSQSKLNRPRVASVLDSPEEYFARLKAEFAKLLSAKAGLAFSFSMKPMGDSAHSWERTKEELDQVFDLIAELLEAHAIPAGIKLEHYQTTAHRFAVFFIDPEESEPSKNKELIAALRQVISTHMSQKVKAVNIFLVLANAQSVIEEHLFKIGAKKLEEED